MITDEDATNEAEETAPADATRKPSGPTMDKRALLKRVVVATGIPAPQARKLLDAALAEIAVALDAGSTLSLPPLGKLRTVRTAERAGKAVHTLRLRRAPAADEATEAGEAGAEAKPGAKARALVKAGATSRRGTAGGGRRSRAAATDTNAAPADDGNADA